MSNETQFDNGEKNIKTISTKKNVLSCPGGILHIVYLF